jgi:hypothetical protein
VKVTVLVCVFLSLTFLLGCQPHSKKSLDTNSSSASPASALFEDIAPRIGINFKHSSGATGKFYFIEIIPAGCALFDYDNDGFLDILLLQSGPSDPSLLQSASPPSSTLFCALYHNNGDGTFTDVTLGSGLDRYLGYTHGVAVGDYDNDGYDDLFITGYRRNFLFRNQYATRNHSRMNRVGNPTPSSSIPLFADVTRKMGLDKLHSTGYATSAAFGDYDNDGLLDLYVCYYCSWTWKKDVACHDSQGRRDYCTPEMYDPDTHRLYHNEGYRFVDVSEKAGITKARGRGLAVAFIDYDDDGDQDIYVANDLTPNMLWRNNGNGTFAEVGLQAGCAYTEGGGLMAGMGIAIADYDHSGRESMFVTNFSLKPNALFKNLGNGQFADVAQAAGLGLPSMRYLAFGCEFMDYDADGWADLLVVNGHVVVHAEVMGPGITYAEPKQLFHNEANGAFREITEKAQLGDLALPTVGRGLAIGDIDNDGRLDALVTNNNGPAQLFRNLDRSANHWVAFKTAGTKSNRDGIHTRIAIVANGMRQTASVRGGSSFLSHSDRRLYFGLGKAEKISRVEIQWPSGLREILTNVPANAIYTLTEGRGITGKLPAKKGH